MRHTLAAGRVLVLLMTLMVARLEAADEPKASGAKTPGVANPPTATSRDLVTGIVLDPAGTPVGGCKVWGQTYAWIAGVKKEVINQVTTDEKGRFGFPNADQQVFFARDPKGRIGWPISTRQRRSSRGVTPVSVQLFEVREYRGRLVDTSGKPIAKARIRPELFEYKEPGQLVASSSSFPPEVATGMACESGSDGSFVLRGVPAEGSISADISARGFGSCLADWPLDAPTTIRLAPAGSVRGSVVCAADPKAAAGVKLRLDCRGDGLFTGPSPWEDVHLYPYAETTTQKDGSFVFVEVPPGEYSPCDTWDGSSPETWGPNSAYCFDWAHRDDDESVVVKSHELTSVGSLTMQPTVPIHGTVVDAKSGAGIPEVVLDLAYPAGLIRTDAKGAYSARVAPGTLKIWVKEVPENYGAHQQFSGAVYMEGTAGTTAPGTRSQQTPTLEVTKETAVPPIRLQPIRTIEGIVADDSGKPVAGAEIVSFAGGMRNDGRTRSDLSGKFIARGGGDDTAVELRARTATAVTATVVKVRAGDGPARLVVSEKDTFHLRGCVVDETGKPVGGAEVTVYYTEYGKNGAFKSFPIDEQDTDAQGRFDFVLWPGERYHVSTVGRDGYGGWSETSSPETDIRSKLGQTYEAPKIVLISLRGTVEGTVVDSAGKPLAGVRVFNNGDAATLIMAKSDAAGRFRLRGLEPGPVYVFASQPDYRFTGVRTTSGATGLVVGLLRKDEPVPPWPRPKPPTYKEQQEFARRCLMKLWPLRDQSGSEEAMILAMARIDFEQAQKWCEASAGVGREMLQRIYIDKVAEKDPDEAVKLAGVTTSDRWGPCDILWSLGKRYAASDPAKAMRFAEKMGSLARRLEPSARARQLARAGSLAIRCGKREIGREWIEGAVAIIPSLRKEKNFDFMLSDLAEAAASYDPAWALTLLEKIDARQREACMGDVAVAGCLVDLPRSLQIISAMKPEQNMSPTTADRAKLRVACRIAATNPDRAVSLAEEIPIDSYFGARASARLAVAMAPHHKSLAWSLMDRALATLPTMLRRPGGWTGGPRTSEVAEFAVWAGQINYPDMESAVYRVLACRPSGRERSLDDGRDELTDMAAKLALVDPQTAKEILRSLERRIELSGVRLTPWNGGELWLTAWALADLKHAEELFDRSLAEPKDTKGLVGHDLWWSGLPKMAEVLVLPPSLRLRAIDQHFNFGPLRYGLFGGLEDEDE